MSTVRGVQRNRVKKKNYFYVTVQRVTVKCCSTKNRKKKNVRGAETAEDRILWTDRVLLFSPLYTSQYRRRWSLCRHWGVLYYIFFSYSYIILRVVVPYDCIIRLCTEWMGRGGFLLSVNAIITRDKRFLNEFYLQFSHFFSTKSFNYVVLYTRIVKHLYNVLNRYKCKHSLVWGDWERAFSPFVLYTHAKHGKTAMFPISDVRFDLVMR